MQILLFKNNSFMGRAIQLFSRGKYNHAAIMVGNTVYEATTDGVRKIKKEGLNSKYKKNTIDFYDLKTPLKTEEEKELILFLEKQIGKKYDFWMVFGFVIYTNKEDRKSWGKWFCSELVMASMEKIGRKLLNAQPWKVNPEMVSYSTEIEYRASLINN